MHADWHRQHDCILHKHTVYPAVAYHLQNAPSGPLGVGGIVISRVVEDWGISWNWEKQSD